MLLNETPEVVLDTNIIVSTALNSEGVPAKIFVMLLEGEIKNYTSDEIISEIVGTFNKEKITKMLKSDYRQFIIHNFEESSEKIYPDLKLNVIQEDPDDNKFLECAVSANAKYIISGDRHLLNLKEFHGIRILSPKEFVDLSNGY